MAEQPTGGGPLPRPHDVGRLVRAPAHLTIEADAEELTRLAAFLGILAVHRVTAELEVGPWRSVGVKVEGTVEAALEQECIVTLEPVVTRVEEAVSMRLMPGDDPRSGGGEVDIDPLGRDDPDTFSGRTIDLGAIVVEHIVLGLDPYPRAPGVTFEEASGAYPSKDDDDRESPFAALGDLKRRLSKRRE